ncbi:DUF4132 domain-containing protein [bacterium]|nr:DUF4132 domain-containing protein [bacterium]
MVKDSYFQRISALKLKKSMGYHQYYSGATLTFSEDLSDGTQYIPEVLSLFEHYHNSSVSIYISEAKNIFTIDSLKQFAKTIYENWATTKDNKTKWLLKIVAEYADDSIIDRLVEDIKELVSLRRGAIAGEIAAIVAGMGTPKALQKANFLEKKIKDSRVQDAAKRGIQDTARRFNLTKEELLDKIIPDFGFSPNGKKLLSYGTRVFELTITPDLDLSITDESGKIIKSLPKPNSNDNAELAKESAEDLKEIKKGVKEQVKLQLERLEKGFTVNRSWRIDLWRELFVNNPIMKKFAMALIWGVFEDVQLTKKIDSFRYLEDGTFSNQHEDTISLPSKGFISLLHPIEMSKEEIERWNEQFKDYEINQPFPQLNRPIFYIDETKKDDMFLRDFEGHMIKRTLLRSRLTAKGWTTGVVEDAGAFYSYEKSYPEYKMYASLEFMGDSIRAIIDDSEVPVYKLIFRLNYNTKCPIKTVPPRLFSEIYYEVKTIIDCGSGFNPNWKKVTWY